MNDEDKKKNEKRQVTKKIGCIPNCRMIEFLNPTGSYVYRKIIVPDKKKNEKRQVTKKNRVHSELSHD
jgi:hypothetical protein